MRGTLKYMVQNCRTALRELCKINAALNESHAKFLDNNWADYGQDSDNELQRLGDLDRILKDYLIMRVACLFDKDTRAISFYNALPNNNEVRSIEEEDIIREIKKYRNKFVAHIDRKHIQNEDLNVVLHTSVLCSSNLSELLERLEKILNL